MGLGRRRSRLHFGGDSDRPDYAVRVSATMIAPASNSAPRPPRPLPALGWKSSSKCATRQASSHPCEPVPLAGKRRHVSPRTRPQPGRFIAYIRGVSSDLTALNLTTLYICCPCKMMSA